VPEGAAASVVVSEREYFFAFCSREGNFPCHCWQPIQIFQLPLKLPTPMSLELQISVAFCKQKTFLFHATFAIGFDLFFHD
jgi:hypothetical protein